MSSSDGKVRIGFLVPCAGGKSVPLNRRRMYLGRHKNMPPDAPDDEVYFCEIMLEEHRVLIRDVNCPHEIRVNGTVVKESPIRSGDLLAIGKLRYRVELAPELDRAPSQENVSQRPAEQTGRGGLRSLLRRRTGSRKSRQDQGEPGVLGVLVPCRGGKTTLLRKERNTVGRKDSCDVVIDDATVSSLHCGLEFVEGCWRIIDLGSRNGVMVNGVAYQKKWLLPSDVISISQSRFRLEYHPERVPSSEEDVLNTSRSLLDIAGIDHAAANRIAERFEQPPERRDPPRRELSDDHSHETAKESGRAEYPRR